MSKKLTSLIEEVLDSSFFSPEEGLIPVLHEPGDSRLLVVTGENASGKSFFARVFEAYSRKDNIECMRVGMEKRTTSGIVKVLMFGDESNESTGLITLRTLQSGVQTCRGREHEHFLVLDEPDIGLSEGYQLAAGEFIARFVSDMPDLTQGAVVITHSRRILRQLLPLKPHHVRCGDTRTLLSVVEEEPKAKTIEDLLALPTVGVQLFRKITGRINEAQARKNR